ncbi:MAG TPA: ABC transporter permease, partial [Candidatus Corynebacterium faecipullorum]|nr:ABC transporter permease [Candidatus Corynebacterium faecipullorum]
VGATRWFTNAPFVFEAVLAVLFGTVLAGVGVYLGKNFVLDPSLKNLYSSQLLAPIRDSDIWVAIPLIGAVAIVFAALAAWVTLRAYVRK